MGTSVTKRMRERGEGRREENNMCKKAMGGKGGERADKEGRHAKAHEPMAPHHHNTGLNEKRYNSCPRPVRTR